VWWDKECDVHFLIGVFTHGYGRYDIIRDDPTLCFGKRIAEAKKDCVIEEQPSDVMKMKIDNEEEGDGEAVVEVEDTMAMDISVDKDVSFQSVTASRGSVQGGAVLDGSAPSQDSSVVREIDDEADAEVEGYRDEKEEKEERKSDRDRDREKDKDKDKEEEKDEEPGDDEEDNEDDGDGEEKLTLKLVLNKRPSQSYSPAPGPALEGKYAVHAMPDPRTLNRYAELYQILGVCLLHCLPI
jgi:hypothetical protein